MLRAKLVLVLMALLAPAAVVPTVAQTSPSGLGIVRALEETLPGNLGNFNERLENLFGLSSHSDAGIDAVAIGNANNTDAINGFASNMPAATQEFDTEGIRSGNGLPSVDISNSGNNVNLCSNVQQSANTGNVVNQQGSAQNPSVSEEIGLRGFSITISPQHQRPVHRALPRVCSQARDKPMYARAGDVSNPGSFLYRSNLQ